MEKLNDYAKTLSEHGVKPSLIRLKVYDFLYKNRIHPTAEIIYQHLHKQIPTLSRTSIYNTLKIFVEANLIKEIIVDDKEKRYDINTCFHAHFKCKICNKVFDLDINHNLNKIKEFYPEIKTIEDVQFFAEGICKECHHKEEKDEGSKN